MRKVTGILCGCAAIALLFLAVGCGPDTVDECLNAGAGYGARGEWKKALKMAERAESLSENSVPALLLRAIAHEQLGERDLALDAARQAPVGRFLDLPLPEYPVLAERCVTAGAA